MPTVSIIILAYNAEDYLSLAMDSALQQTLRDIEVVVVNDGSTDSTPRILSAYAAKDPRVVIVDNEENRGMTYSRWNGVRHSKGRYIMFLDADDMLIPNACEVLSREMEREDWDIFMFGSSLIAEYIGGVAPESRIQEFRAVLKPPVGPFPKGRGAMLEVLAERKFSFTVWNKIFKRSILKAAFSQYKGERIQMAEDLLIVTMAFAYAASFGSTQQAFYRYRIGSGVSTAITISDRNLESYALEGRVYTLLKKWLPKTGLKSYVYGSMLRYAHETVSNDMWWAFFYRVRPEQRPRMLETMGTYWTGEELGLELADFIFKKRKVSPEKAVAMLKGCFPVDSTKTIKTIGMFYYRLYNGGVERVMSLLSPILEKAGYRVVIFTENGPTEEDYPIPDTVSHIQMKTGSFDPIGRMEEWQKLIKEYDIDLFIYHAYRHTDMALDSFSIKSTGAHLSLFFHSSISSPLRYPLDSGINWTRQREIMALFDSAITLSEVDCAWFRALGFHAVQVANPLTFQPAKVSCSSLSEKRAVWVGRLSPEKQYSEAFEIARLVHEKLPEFTLHIVGKAETNEQTAEIMSYVNEQKMSEYVLFDGYHEDVSEDYRKASVYLCTSAFEGFPMVLEEAKVFGLPIVSYEVSNLTLLRQPNSGVFVVPQGDRNAAAERIIRLLSDEKLRKKMGKQARKSIEELYGDDESAYWQNIIEQLTAEPAPEVPVYRRSPLESAVCMAMDSVSPALEEVARAEWVNAGEVERSHAHIQQLSEQTQHLSEEVRRVNEENAALRTSNQYFENAIHEIHRSTSWKLGYFLTWPLRKIKDFLLSLRKK